MHGHEVHRTCVHTLFNEMTYGSPLRVRETRSVLGVICNGIKRPIKRTERKRSQSGRVSVNSHRLPPGTNPTKRHTVRASAADADAVCAEVCSALPWSSTPRLVSVHVHDRHVLWQHREHAPPTQVNPKSTPTTRTSSSNRPTQHALIDLLTHERPTNTARASRRRPWCARYCAASRRPCRGRAAASRRASRGKVCPTRCRRPS